MTPEKLLFSFLNAATLYGHRAGRIDERFCRQILGIGNPRAAVATLIRQGLPVQYAEDGAIALQQEVPQ